MRILLIVNTSASSVTARTRVVIHKSLSADHEVTLAETSRRGHATRLAQSAARTVDAVVVLGGDGTVNEAANGLAGTSCALGVLPGGSTNVFARSIGMTNDPIEATGELLGALAATDQRVRTIGLGNVNGRRYLFHAGVGFDAAVVAQVERRAALKRYLGAGFFAYAAIDTWARHYDRHRPHFSLAWQRADGTTAAIDDGYFAIVLNTNPYTYLGERAFDVAPGTTLDSPLSAVVFRSVGAVTILGAGLDALRGGMRVRRHRKVELADQVVSAAVRVADDRSPVPYQVDGDYLGDARDLRFRWEPASLRLVVPLRDDGVVAVPDGHPSRTATTTRRP